MSDQTKSRDGRRAGLSLLVVALVCFALGAIAVLSLLAGRVVVAGADSCVRDGATREARADLLVIRRALQQHAITHGGAFPRSLSDLDRWDELSSGKEAIFDPWGHPFQYIAPTSQAPSPTVLCLGSDGKSGGSGDAADFDDETVVAGER